MNPEIKVTGKIMPISPGVRRLNPKLYGDPALVLHDQHGKPTAQVEKPKKRIRQSTKPLMNRLEAEFYERIKTPSVHIQAITLKLANGLRYTPDFFCAQSRCAWEVKGKWVDGDSFPKLKMAASVWPDIHFILVWKDKDGQWTSQRILA